MKYQGKMKKIKQLIVAIGMAFVAFSCGSDKPSLQEYFVNNNDDPNFISLDIPSSILNVSETSLDEKQQEAYESVKKLNVLAFKITPENKLQYEAEKKTVQEILKDDRYEELMVLNSGKHRGVVKYLGDDETIEEIVLFGSSDENGFALIRVLGNKMKPENMMALVEAAQKGAVDASGVEKQLQGLFD